MLVHRWKTPIVYNDDGLKFTIGSPEEAITWMVHEPEKASPKWRLAWSACKGAVEERSNAEQARSAIIVALER